MIVHCSSRCHSRNSSLDISRVTVNGRGSVINGRGNGNSGHSRAASLGNHVPNHHSRNSSADLNKYIRNDALNLVFGYNQGSNWADPLRVQIIKAHHNWIVVAYAHFIVCYR